MSTHLAPAKMPVQNAAAVPLCDCLSQDDAPTSPARQWVDGVLLLLLWLLHCAGNLWWLWVDTRPPYSDMAGHAVTTLRMASWTWLQLLMNGGFIETLFKIGPYPPFFYLTTMPLVWVIGPSIDVMLVVNMLYLGLLLFSTYGIGRIAVSGRAGLLAAFLVSLYPLVYALSRHYLADIALMAMVTFAIFCLFWGRAFERRWPSIVLGVVIGLGMLTKWTFIVFLVGPLAIAVYLTLRHATRARLLNLVMAGLLSLLIGLPWYLYNLESLRDFIEFNRVVAPSQEGEAPIWSLASWLYYLRELLTQQMLLPFFLLFVVGSVLALRRCRLNSYFWMLLSWVVVGYVASTLFPNKDTRYTMPYLSALALITAIGLVQIRSVIVKRVGLVTIILYALLQYAGLTVGLSKHVAGMPPQLSWVMKPLAATLYTEVVHVATPARVEDWQIDPILASVMADAQERGVALPLSLVMIPAAESFDARAVAYVRWRDRLPVDVSLVSSILEIDGADVLRTSDYVVTKSGNLGLDFILQDADELTRLLLDSNSTLSAEFERIAEFPLPDGSVALLFRHIDEYRK